VLACQACPRLPSGIREKLREDKLEDCRNDRKAAASEQMLWRFPMAFSPVCVAEMKRILSFLTEPGVCSAFKKQRLPPAVIKKRERKSCLSAGDM